MTDNESIKGLECCISDCYTCKECPYADTKHMIGDEYEIMPNGKIYDELSCDDWLKLDLFDLINRQKAEIERLEKEKLSIIEHLKKARKQLKTAKAEAVKEFALELKSIPRISVYKNEIDNLLRKKVGESDV